MNIPKERAEIALLQQARKALADAGEITSIFRRDLMHDIDVLLGDCAAWRNAHSILLAERDQLKAAKLQHDTQQRAAALALHDERIERLEAALREYTEGDEYRDSESWGERHDPWDPFYIRFRKAQEALAAADGQIDPMELKHWCCLCERKFLTAEARDLHEDACTQSAVRKPSREEERGYAKGVADMRAQGMRVIEKTVDAALADPHPIPGIDQGQFLAACGGANAVFGEGGTFGGTPE